MDSKFTPSPRPVKRPSLPGGWRIWLAATLAAYILLLLLTRPSDYVDSLNYAKNVADQYHQHLVGTNNPFFDFGHVLWKPLVYLVWRPLRGLLLTKFHGDDILAAASVEIALNITGGLLGAVFLFLLIARTTRSSISAGIATIGYLTANGVLFYAQNGMSYVPGIACQIVAIYLLQDSLSEGRFTFSRGVISGLFLGLSIVIWFPYVLAAGGIFCYALLSQDAEDGPSVLRRAAGLAGLVAGTAAITMLVYGSVIVMARFTSVDAVMGWISRSRYGKLPDRGLLRMLGGIPRGLLSLGDLDLAIKRMLFEHHSLRLMTLVQVGVWKTALVYLVLATAAVTLFRSTWGRRLLVALAAIAIPLAIFGAFLFEATPPERYLAAFPLLFLAFGRILADRQSHLFPRLLLGLFFVCMLATNAGGLSRFGSDSGIEAARARVEAVNQRIVLPQDRVVLLTYGDETYHLIQAEPFDALSRNRYCYYVGLPWGAEHKERWRIDFANSTARTWSGGGHVWLSLRFVAASPDPAWGWVEGDLEGIRWQDVGEFFRKLELINPCGGTDGFAEVARTSRNELLLNAVIEGKPW